MKCPYCFQLLEVDMFFCPNCGAKVSHVKRKIALGLIIFEFVYCLWGLFSKLYTMMSLSMFSYSNVLYILKLAVTMFFLACILLKRTDLSKKLLLISLAALSAIKIARSVYSFTYFSWSNGHAALRFVYIILGAYSFAYVLLYGLIKNVSTEKIAAVISFVTMALQLIIEVVIYDYSFGILLIDTVLALALPAVLFIYPVVTRPVIIQKYKR